MQDCTYKDYYLQLSDGNSHMLLPRNVSRLYVWLYVNGHFIDIALGQAAQANAGLHVPVGDNASSNDTYTSHPFILIDADHPWCGEVHVIGNGAYIWCVEVSQ